MPQSRPLDSFLTVCERVKMLPRQWETLPTELRAVPVSDGLERDNDRRKIALLLTVAGRSAIDVFNTFQFSVEE